MFKRARIKLTAWYLLIIMLVSVMFSMVIYRFIANEVDRFEYAQRLRIERRFKGTLSPIPASPELLQEIKHRVSLTLILVNSVIFTLSGGLGYLLAGRTLRPIKDMVDEQNRFISDASHELKTPLTSLKSAFEVYLRDNHKSLEDANSVISESISEVDKLQSLSESMLQLIQYQKPNGNIKPQKNSIKEILQESVHKVSRFAKRKRITINSDQKDVEIMSDKYSLIDLFVIILDNAIKYGKAGNNIKIDVEKLDGYLAITVTNHGIGIDDKDLPHIFERFYRADVARSKNKEGGYGLGLSIAKKIVENHNGTILARNDRKSVTSFTVRLPLNNFRFFKDPYLSAKFQI